MRQIQIYLDSRDLYLFYKDLIRQGENLASELVVNLNNEFKDYKYQLVLQNNSSIPVATAELTPIENIITYVLTNAVTSSAGILKVVFHAYDLVTGLLIKSAIINLRVIESIEGAEAMPEAYVPWHDEAVKQANIATTQAVIATNKAAEVTAKLEAINVTTWQSLLSI